jgi:ATP-dependent DNA helicase PIF1
MYTHDNAMCDDEDGDRGQTRDHTDEIKRDCQTNFVPTEMVDESKDEKIPTLKQQFVLDIVQDQVRKLNCHLQKDTKPLRMLVLGTAGSGKSFVIKKLRSILGTSLEVSATTGAAGVLIGGATLHSLLKLPVRSKHKKPLAGNALRKLQNNWKSKSLFQQTSNQFLIVDEISMLGKNALYWVDQRLRQATCVNELFGGVNVLFFGDFAQLFPVRDSAMFLPPSLDDTLENLRASVLYKSFSDVVILDDNLRAQDEAFKTLLLRLRDGVCTDDDYQLLKSRFATLKHLSSHEISRFDDSVRLFY